MYTKTNKFLTILTVKQAAAIAAQLPAGAATGPDFARRIYKQAFASVRRGRVHLNGGWAFDMMPGTVANPFI